MPKIRNVGSFGRSSAGARRKKKCFANKTKEEYAQICETEKTRHRQTSISKANQLKAKEKKQQKLSKQKMIKAISRQAENEEASRIRKDADNAKKKKSREAESTDIARRRKNIENLKRAGKNTNFVSKFACLIPQDQVTSTNLSHLKDSCNSEVKPIGQQRTCKYCFAKLFSSESIGFCCLEGKVQMLDYLTKLQDIPEPLRSILLNKNNKHKKTLDNLRGYNSSFSMASLGWEHKTKNGERVNGESVMTGFSPTLKFHGTMYCRVPSLIPAPGAPRKFAQWFIHDGTMAAEEEARGRINVHKNTKKYDLNTMLKLQEMLHKENALIQDFKMVSELPQNMVKNVEFILKKDGKPEKGHKSQYSLPYGHETNELHIRKKSYQKGHKGRYHLPSGLGTREVALITLDDQPEGANMQVFPRDGADMQIYIRDGPPIQSWTDLNCYYDPLHFVLIHVCGKPYGWTWELQLSNGRRLSPAMFYRFMLQVRDENIFFNNILRSRRLMQEYVCAMYYKVERQRMKYYKEHQKELKIEKRQGLMDAIHSDDDPTQIGDRIILPASFTSGPRWYQEKCNDGMSILREYGTPTFFITFTANAKWPEIQMSLHENETSEDRPDIVVRVFKEYLSQFFDDIMKRDMLGRCFAILAMNEFQKRGLPHNHSLTWIHPDDAPRGPDDYRKFISAEIPDPKTDKELHDLVMKYMIHGPCDGYDGGPPINPSAPCLSKGLTGKKCEKNYPKKFAKDFSHGDNTEITYQRRSPEDGGFKGRTRCNALNRDEIVDNRSVVPYNRVMLMKYKAHINIEICYSHRSIKYVVKYTCKGSDRIIVENSDGTLCMDEITTYVNGNYIGATDAFWRLYEFPICYMVPSVQKLPLHLENQQFVLFQETDDLAQVAENSKETQLTAFFKLNQMDPEANCHLYCDILKHYSFDKKTKSFKKRKNNDQRGGTVSDAKSDCIGRIPVVSINCHNKELFFLRVLLYNVPGPKGYDDLKTVTVDNVTTVCKTFQDACIKRGLLEDDKEIEKALEEATTLKFAKAFRHCFVTIVLFVMPSDPAALFEKFKNNMCEDYIKNVEKKEGLILLEPTEEMINKALLHLQDMFEAAGKDMAKDYNLPQPVIETKEKSVPKVIQFELNHLDSSLAYEAEVNIAKMNAEQKEAFSKIFQAIESEGGVFAIDAPGGAGKTFVIITLLDSVRGGEDGGIALAMATSGLAATLLPGGGTVHSKLRVPINLEEDQTISEMTKDGALKELMKKVKLMIIDEMTMATRKMINCIDRSLKEILDETKPFGGVTVVFSGDWRQCLPVVPRASKAEILHETIKETEAWQHVETFQLTQNMRLRSGVNEEDVKKIAKFADYLLKVGEGREETFPKIGEDMIKIPYELKSKAETLEEFCDEIFPNMNNIVRQGLQSDDPTNGWTDWLMERAIIVPTNNEANDVNNICIEKFPGEKVKVYKSFDKAINCKEEHNYPTEFLNSIQVSSIPPHEIKLKIGSPFMLIRRLDPVNGHINGTRYIVKALTDRIIHGEIAFPLKFKGNQIFIPRILFHPKDMTIGFEFERKQFPIRSCFALTSNKSQGQSLKRVGIYMEKEFFSHGQLYVAMSRVRHPDDLSIFKDKSSNQNYMKNVVFKEILSKTKTTSEDIEREDVEYMEYNEYVDYVEHEHLEEFVSMH